MKKKLCLIKISKQDSEKCSQLYTPKFESDLETSKNFPIGQMVVGSITKQAIRNYLFLKKFFAMINCAYFHMPEQYADRYKSVEELRKALTAQAGFRTEHVSLSGKTFYEVDSISFEKMSAERFEDLYSKVFDEVCKYIFAGVQTKEVENQILAFM